MVFTERAGSEPQQSRPGLKSQALADEWSESEMMAPVVYSQEGSPTHGKFEFRFAWEGENSAQESLGTFSTTRYLPPPSVPITPPHSDRQNLC